MSNAQNANGSAQSLEIFATSVARPNERLVIVIDDEDEDEDEDVKCRFFGGWPSDLRDFPVRSGKPRNQPASHACKQRKAGFAAGTGSCFTIRCACLEKRQGRKAVLR